MITIDKVISKSMCCLFKSSIVRWTISSMVEQLTNTNRVIVGNKWLRSLDASSTPQGLSFMTQGSKIKIKQGGKTDSSQGCTSKPYGGDNALGQVMFLFLSSGYFQGFLSGSCY